MTVLAINFDQIRTALVAPNTVPSGQFTFSIPGTGAEWTGYAAGEEQDTFKPLNTDQAARFVAAIQAWDDLIAPDFAQTVDSASPGFIRVGFSTHADLKDAWGYAALPPRSTALLQPQNGDIWINDLVKDGSFQALSFDYAVLIHEIGHALGLLHPFSSPSFPGAYDDKRYTVMAYDAESYVHVRFEVSGGYIRSLPTVVYPSTPMVLDIAAIQEKYGADPDTQAWDSVYTFAQGQGIAQSIYDAGGIDTIDASRFDRPSDIDLTPGAYSSLGTFSVDDQIASAIRTYGPAAETFVRDVFAKAGAAAYTGKDNLGIAFSSTIENAVGGNGSDTITGNAARNGLYGGPGADSMRGLDGDDVVEGQGGDDDINGNVGFDIVRGGDGADWVRGGRDNDTVYGDAGADPHVNGNIGDDVVFGGAGGDTTFGGQGADTIYGEDGDDWLSGDLGPDALVGGAGADRFLFRVGSGADTVRDFSSAAGDRVQLVPGAAYSLSVVGDSIVVDLGGGDRLTLAGVGQTQLGDWLVFV